MFKKLMYIYGVYRLCSIISAAVDGACEAINEQHEKRESEGKNAEISKMYSEGCSRAMIYATGNGRYSMDRVNDVCDRYDRFDSTGRIAEA